MPDALHVLPCITSLAALHLTVPVLLCVQLLLLEVGDYLGGICALRGAGRSWYRFNVTAGGAFNLKVNAQHCS